MTSAQQYPLTFQAAVLEETGRQLAIDEVTFDGPLEEGQVLVKIHASGVCGKQVEEFLATRGPDPYLPHMLGHEASGHVADIGPGVAKVKVGDAVAVSWIPGDGKDAAKPSYHRRSDPINAGPVATFGQFAVVPENRVTPIAPDLDLNVAAMLGCAVITGVGAILNEAKLRNDDEVTIIGCGGVGLHAIQAAASVSANPIIAVDLNEENLVLARRFGATHALKASEGAVAEANAILGRDGARNVIVTAPALAAIELGAEMTSHDGTMRLVGVPPPGKVSVDGFAIHMGRTLTGSYGGGARPDTDIPRAQELWREGKLTPEGVVARVVPLEEVNDAISAMQAGTAGRWILRMNHAR